MPGLKDEWGGTIATGTATIGLSAVILRAANRARRSVVLQCQGPGNLFFGGSGVSTANTPKVKVDGALTLDSNGDDIWAVSDQAGTVATFIEEIAP